MTEGAHTRLGFSAIGGRKAKAEKIAAILAAAGRPLKPTDEVLDLGCGSGEIAEHLGTRAQVVCADAQDQRTQGRDLPFRLVDRELPFEPDRFDVVISNHVIEHTQDPAGHLREIRRILKPAGIVYLATPNRLWPWEVHARVVFLHYLPWRIFSRLGMALGRLHEPVRLLSLRRLQQMISGQYRSETWHQRIIQDPERFALKIPNTIRTLLSRTPTRALEVTAALQPTLILLLTPK